MQAKSTFSYRFYCRKSKSAKNGLSPIELSVIVGGERVFVTLPRKMSPKDFEKDMAKRSNNETKTFILTYEAKVNNAVTEILQRNDSLTAQRIKDYVTGQANHVMTLGRLIKEFMQLQKERTKKEISLGRYNRYSLTFDILLDFIGDKEISKIKVGDMQSFKTHILSTREASTTYAYMAQVKTLFKFAVDNGWLTISPMNGVKTPKGQKKIEIPTMEEYFRIVNRHFSILRLEKVRDIFVLAASSGLAYSDLMLLEKEDIKTADDGTVFIEKKRKKTNVIYTAVILPEGVEVLRKYDYDITPLKITGQKQNAFLKEIRDICGISANLTMHVGRHLYCSRLMMSGVSPAIVQRALGHSRITTTQMYYTHLTTESVIRNIKEAVN